MGVFRLISGIMSVIGRDVEGGVAVVWSLLLKSLDIKTLHNYTTLSPSGFETLAADILSAEHSVIFEHHGEAPDGGIDCRDRVMDRFVNPRDESALPTPMLRSPS